MNTRRFLIESLRSHLKAQQITYKDIAQSLGNAVLNPGQTFQHFALPITSSNPS
jgi:hypothetical protein